MPVSKDLVDILCCPVTKTPVRLATPEELATLNAAIALGKVKHADGSTVDAALEEALITEDKASVYKVLDSIPIMLKEQAIPLAELALP
ncbi:MAG: hypothetical protein MUF01_16660 [Bryobacterales bacterium]|jgi:uncharacterized protein YbaR (Trm112 family)|nr:hypothetical protein [Bryobacterales bacterium]